MLRLLLPKAQGRKDFWKSSKPYHVGTHWIALAEYSQISTHMPGLQSFLKHVRIILVLTDLASSSHRVKHEWVEPHGRPPHGSPDIDECDVEHINSFPGLMLLAGLLSESTIGSGSNITFNLPSSQIGRPLILTLIYQVFKWKKEFIRGVLKVIETGTK